MSAPPEATTPWASLTDGPVPAVTLGVSLEVLLALTLVGALWFIQRRRALA